MMVLECWTESLHFWVVSVDELLLTVRVFCSLSSSSGLSLGVGSGLFGRVFQARSFEPEIKKKTKMTDCEIMVLGNTFLLALSRPCERTRTIHIPKKKQHNTVHHSHSVHPSIQLLLLVIVNSSVRRL